MMKTFEKTCASVASFLDNKTFHLAFTIILILLVSTLFTNLNHSLRAFASHKLVRLLWVLLIVCVATKHMPCALLLAVLYVLSISGFSEGFEDSAVMTKENVPTTAPDVDVGKGEASSGNVPTVGPDALRGMKDRKEKKDGDMLSAIMDSAKGMMPQQTETKEDFVPFFLTNRDFEDNYESPLKGGRRGACLSTDPNHFELVGDACKPVAVFEGELNAQGMNDITGFNINNDMTAHPL